MCKLARIKVLAALIALVAPHGVLADGVDLVSVEKSQRVLRLHAGDQVIREYAISLGGDPRGHKFREGDQRTPEGRYLLDWRNPDSKYFRSIRISYPNARDQARARQAGLSPGGDIFIHGLPNGKGEQHKQFNGRDWTDGCIAVNDNEQMWEIWRLVKNGTPILINP